MLFSNLIHVQGGKYTNHLAEEYLEIPDGVKCVVTIDDDIDLIEPDLDQKCSVSNIHRFNFPT